MTCLYLHLPFCRRKCRYCAFDSVIAPPSVFARYIPALKREIAELASINPHRRLRTLFIGGGTPTLLPVEMLTGIVEQVGANFLLDNTAEVTVEANPGTVDERYLMALRRVGINRLSLGVQSFSDSALHLLGRIHSGVDAKNAFALARKAGFTNINLDLMYGLPGQSGKEWADTLCQAIELKPEHLSLYQLTLEQKTPLYNLVKSGQLAAPEEEEIAVMDEITEAHCAAGGLVRYEIANYARQGYRCRHNINYWENKEYFACGAGAVSYSKGKREKRITDPRRYSGMVVKGENPVVESEQLSHEASFRETMIMGLRMMEGVDLVSLHRRYGIDAKKYYGTVLTELLQKGLLEETDNFLRLTKIGRNLANLVQVELV